MNWKSTAVVSGATVLATWFASVPPVQHTTTPVGEPAASTTVTSRASDQIVREADRLSARLHPSMPYQGPLRNPFQFSQPRRATSAPRATSRQPKVSDASMTETPVAPPLRVSLTGIAEDTSGAAPVRTAVISTPDDVMLVKEGEMVAGQYKVTAVTANSVDLTRVSDGSVVRLTLRP